MKKLLTLCSIKLTWILFVFHLAWNRRRGSAAKKFWLGLQFCCILQRVLQLQYLQMSGNISSTLIRWATISPCFVGVRRPHRNSSKIEVPEIRDLFVLTILTTDSLSQKNSMRLFEKKLAHRWQETTKANNSCHAMEMPGWPSFWWGSHEPWNQLVWKTPPNRKEPEAHVYRDKTSEVTQEEVIKKPAPFQLHKKSSHILRTLKKPLLNLIRWWGKEMFLVSWILRCSNGRLAGITLHAKFERANKWL